MEKFDKQKCVYLQSIISEVEKNLISEYESLHIRVPSFENHYLKNIGFFNLLFFTSNRGFVEACYWKFLKRNADYSGLLNYCQLLAERKLSRVRLCAIFSRCEESQYGCLPWWFFIVKSLDAVIFLDMGWGSSLMIANSEINSIISEFKNEQNIKRVDELISIVFDIAQYLHEERDTK